MVNKCTQSIGKLRLLLACCIAAGFSPVGWSIFFFVCIVWFVVFHQSDPMFESMKRKKADRERKSKKKKVELTKKSFQSKRQHCLERFSFLPQLGFVFNLRNTHDGQDHAQLSTYTTTSRIVCRNKMNEKTKW